MRTTPTPSSPAPAVPPTQTQPIAQRRFNLADEEATIAFGRAVAATTQLAPAETGRGAPTAGAVLHLQGDLGAGKTTFTRGFMRAYGHEGAVKSPTYTLVEPYEFEHCNIYHFDLYRLADPEEFDYLGTEQYFDPSNLCLVEWADKGRGWVPAADLRIELIERDGGREAFCAALSTRGAGLLEALVG